VPVIPTEVPAIPTAATSQRRAAAPELQAAQPATPKITSITADCSGNGTLTVKNPVAGATITLVLTYNIPGDPTKFIPTSNTTTIILTDGQTSYPFTIDTTTGVPSDANTVRVEVQSTSIPVTGEDTKSRSFGPCKAPTVAPTATTQPTATATATTQPTATATTQPTATATTQPTSTPVDPTRTPTSTPVDPTNTPTTAPTLVPTRGPDVFPTSAVKPGAKTTTAAAKVSALPSTGAGTGNEADAASTSTSKPAILIYGALSMAVLMFAGGLGWRRRTRR